MRWKVGTRARGEAEASESGEVDAQAAARFDLGAEWDHDRCGVFLSGGGTRGVSDSGASGALPGL
jgi:hypothetical protein